MGMHHGFIAATASLDDLLWEIGTQTGELTREGEPVPLDHIDFHTGGDGGWSLAGGEHDGNAYIFDPSLLLSDQPDMVMRMSQRLGVVVGCGAETVSGTFYLAVGSEGQMRRYLFIQYAGITRGMGIGAPPLNCELREDFDLEAPDGSGLYAAMEEVGLDPRPWLREGYAQPLKYTYERSPEDGPVAAIRREHCERYKRPEDPWLSELQVSASQSSD